MLGMPTCEEVAQKASEYLDGELSFREAMLLRLHLAMCKTCNAFVRSIRRVIKLAPQLLPLQGCEEDAKDVERLLGEALK